jgi:asparagine synthase (glutamine-hydrolysing)
VSGICGIALQKKQDHVNIGHLASMTQALNAPAQKGAPIVTLGSIGLGAQGFPGRLSGVVQLTVNGYPLGLAFHGSLYNSPTFCPGAAQDVNPLEQILRGYLKEGIAFVPRLRGEFALALWDGREDRLYLASDRFRVHPLFYAHDAEKLVFASRMQGLLAYPLMVDCSINPEAVVDVVASSFVPTPKTIFREVKKLPPGHVLTYQQGMIRIEPYWDIDFLHPEGTDEATLAQRLKSHMAEALAIRLTREGDIHRIGTFLSGGVDSSTITGLVTHLTKRPVKSFSIGFAEAGFNEIHYARIAAQAFGAEHHEYVVTPDDACEAIPVLLTAFDEPFANASALPTYFCAKVAHQHGVEVLYAGDGGDELFAGNERYATQRLLEYYSWLPSGLRSHCVEPLVARLAGKCGWACFVKGHKYVRRASIPHPDRLSSYGFFRAFPLVNFFSDDLIASIGLNYDPYAPVATYYRQAPARDELDRQLYIDLKLAISDNDLFKVTRMTEAAGVAVRFPFLDDRLAEFAAGVPAAIKMRGRHLRSFFKRAYADLLPKHGFGLPIPIWLRTHKQMNEMMHDLVLSPQSLQRGYFRKRALEALVEDHKTDTTSYYGTILWNLMILELWHRRRASIQVG